MNLIRFTKGCNNTRGRYCISLLALLAFSLLSMARAQGSPDIVWSLLGHSGAVKTVSFSPDGRYFASGGNDGAIQLRAAHNGSLVRTLAGHSWGVTSIAFWPDSQYLLSGGNDADVRQWRVADGSLVRTLYHDDSVTAVDVSPNGALLASSESWCHYGIYNAEIALWRSTDGALLGWWGAHYIHVSWVKFSPDSTLLASGGGWSDPTVRLWQVPAVNLVRTLSGHSGRVNCIVFSPDGSIVASAGADNLIILWRVADGARLRTLTGHGGAVQSIAFSPDGRYLLSGSVDNTLRIWQVSDGTQVRLYNQQTQGGVNAVAYLRNGRLFGYGRGDGTLVVARNPFWQAGDVDGNGCVEGADLLVVLRAFGQTDGSLSDIDGDGIVDDADLLMVLFNFGSGC